MPSVVSCRWEGQTIGELIMSMTDEVTRENTLIGELGRIQVY